jgi:hypothetical protein
LDLSGPYRKVFDTMVPDATQVADPFHIVRLANTKLDECRRRVQTETLRHRGRKDDPLYRARRLLTKAHERLDERGDAERRGLLRAGDPRGEVQMAWHAKGTIRSVYDITDPALAAEYVAQLTDDLQDADARRGQLTGSHHQPLAVLDRGVAPGPRLERTDGGGQQPGEAGQAGIEFGIVPAMVCEFGFFGAAAFWGLG